MSRSLGPLLIACPLLLNAGLGGMNPPPATTPTTIWRWSGGAWDVIDASGPPIRSLAGVAYDARRDRLVLFGGAEPPNRALGDTWVWSGGARSRVGSDLLPRTRSCLVPTSRGVFLLGGLRVPAVEAVPLLSGGEWRPEPRSPNPGPRYMTAAAYDPARGVTVLYGGGAPSGDSLYSDTWEFDFEHGWRRLR